MFNNGLGKPAGPFSTADIWMPPMDSLGNYTISPGQPFGPVSLAWQYADSPAYYSNILSSVQRLPGNHTLICEGTTGHFFEIDSAGNTVWSYVNPIEATGALNQGDSVTGNSVFRATKYAPDFAGFTGHNLVGIAPIEGNPLPPLPGCEATAAPGITLAQGLQLAPNPAQDAVTIVSLPAGKHGLTVMDLQGKTVYNTPAVQAGDRMTLQNWPAGLYFFRLTGSTQAIKIVKQ